MSSIAHYFKLPFKFKIASRLGRLQYVLLHFIIALSVIGISIFVFNMGDEYFPLVLIFGAALIVFKMYITIPRLHDCNVSGWWVLPLALVSLLIGGLPLLLLFFWPGTKEENKYGNSSTSIWIPKKG